jgi:Protein of unknown function (DUF3301)
MLQLGWGGLVLLCLAAALAWFWQDSLVARERANEAAMEACQRLGLQFLDGTAAFARIAFARRGSGWLTFRRTYVFDYTANSIERRQGFVVLLAHRVESIGYAAGEDRPPAPRAPAAPPQFDAPRVLDLEQWRTRQRTNAESERDEGSG